MNNEQRKMIRTGYTAGLTTEDIADAARVSVVDAEIYLAWWCDRSCPEINAVDRG